MSLLDEIFEHKRREVSARRSAVPPAIMVASAGRAPAPRDFLAALRARAAAAGRPALIAEVKRRSPSRGLLAPSFDPLALAAAYAANGAATISVLTDERYFGGSLDDLSRVAAALGPNRPPLLRKDFLCDPYQLYEARAAGADAILLIVAALPQPLLEELHGLAATLGMAALVEVHTAAEMERAVALRPALLGINNRNLADFTVDLDTTLRLLPAVPDGTAVVAESGIRGPEDLARLAAAGVTAVLIGEGLVTATDVPAAVRAIAGPSRPGDGRPGAAAHLRRRGSSKPGAGALREATP